MFMNSNSVKIDTSSTYLSRSNRGLLRNSKQSPGRKIKTNNYLCIQTRPDKKFLHALYGKPNSTKNDGFWDYIQALFDEYKRAVSSAAMATHRTYYSLSVRASWLNVS